MSTKKPNPKPSKPVYDPYGHSQRNTNKIIGTDYDPNKTYQTSKGTQGVRKTEGIERGWNNLEDWMNDAARNTGNFGSSAASFLTSQPQPKAGAGFGDYLVGSAPKPKAPKPLPVNRGDFGDHTAGPLSSQLAGDDSLVKDQAYYENWARQNAGGPDYSALMAQLGKSHGENDARLEAMYRQLRGSIDADAAPIAQQYAASGQAINQNADQAAAGVKAGYDAARTAQADMFAKLGIGDAAAVLASQGGLASQEQGANNADIEKNRATNLNANELNKGTGLSYNTKIGNAAGLEGNMQRAGNTRAYEDRLADLQTKQTEAQSNSARDLLSLASQKRDLDQSFEPQTLSVNEELQNQKLAAEIQSIVSKGTPTQKRNLSQAQAEWEAMGGKLDDRDGFLEFLKASKGY